MSNNNMIPNIKDFIDKCENKFSYDSTKFSIHSVKNVNLNERYGDILLLHTKLNNPEESPLLVIPGFSMKSSCDILEIILNAVSDVENKFSDLFLVFWGKKIDDINQDIRKLPTKEERFNASFDFKEELAPVMDKILRSPQLVDLKNITLMGKSAGGGVSIFLTNMNKNIKTLLLVCPAIEAEKISLENRKDDLKIKMMWNKDDSKVPYTNSEQFIKRFKEYKIPYKFYLYDTGDHDLNPKFLKEL